MKYYNHRKLRIPKYLTVQDKLGKLSDEQKRNLKIDLAMIPAWENDRNHIRGIINDFKKYDGNALNYAASTLMHLCVDLDRTLNTSGSFYDISRKWREAKESLAKKGLDKKNNALRIYDTKPLDMMIYFLEGSKNILINVINDTDKNLNEWEQKVGFRKEKSGWFGKEVLINELEKWENKKKFYINLYNSIFNEVESQESIKLISSFLDDYIVFSNYIVQLNELDDKLYTANEKKGAIERFEQKYGSAFAKASAADKLSRNRADSIRSLVKKTKNCPYCGNILGDNPHLDHIYPISKGGLSIVENLVWCCAMCNSKKSDKGLTQFIIANGLHMEIVISNLHSLGKHV